MQNDLAFWDSRSHDALKTLYHFIRCSQLEYVGQEGRAPIQVNTKTHFESCDVMHSVYLKSLYMSPAFPVFHTVITVNTGLINLSLYSRDSVQYVQLLRY